MSANSYKHLKQMKNRNFQQRVSLSNFNEMNELFRKQKLPQLTQYIRGNLNSPVTIKLNFILK